MTIATPNQTEQLRADAEGRLRAGTAPSTAGWAVGADALSLLYRLASDPERSADTLKLLHELQTHQVELDLQHVQLAENENDLNLQLAHFQALFERAPAAYLVLDRDGRIRQSNRTASVLFGREADQFENHLLSTLLTPESGSTLLAALECAKTDVSTGAVQVRMLDSRPLGLLVGIAPGQEAVQVLLFPSSRNREG
ncbi:MAG: PAS domain-containing protein [Xanthomonadaceae bacterium]|nr:PAS domain-containing protein [Xanthomonadaceae bacterium]